MYELELVKCESHDIVFLFNLANDKEVRNNAKNSGQISWEKHQEWFSNKLKNENTQIYILKKREVPIGQIRFDLINDEWVVDYSVISEERGKGYGLILIEKGIEHLKKEVKNRSFFVTGEVFRNNIGSCKVFEKLDFVRINNNETIINQLVVYKKNIQ